MFKSSIESKPKGNSILSKNLTVSLVVVYLLLSITQDSHKLSLLFIRGLILIIIFRKPMTWSTVHDEMLCQEILVVDPFTATKKGTAARGRRKLKQNSASVL